MGRSPLADSDGAIQLLPFLNLLALLCMAHFLGDFGLQSDRMALEKCPGCSGSVPWQWWLSGHGAIHGLLVGLITGQPLLGLAEWGLHCLIDLGKCRRRYSMSTDQGLHLLCKVMWAALTLA
jgi:hypothetical protein